MLLIRTRAKQFELPKGHVEEGESHADAAARELCEETGLLHASPPTRELGDLDYRFDGDPPVHKRVRCFLFLTDAPELGALPKGTRERRWIHAHEIAELPLRHENLRPLLTAALQPG